MDAVSYSKFSHPFNPEPSQTQRNAMNLSTYQDKISELASQPKKAVRYYFYTALSGTLDPHYHEMREVLKEKTGLSESELNAMLRAEDERWNEKQLKVTGLFEQSDWIRRFIKTNSSGFSSRTISADQASQFLSDLFSMALQKASIIDHASHMKTREVSLFLAALDDPARLKPLRGAILHPITGAMKEKWPISSDEFLYRRMAVSQSLAYYWLWLYKEQEPGGRCECVRESLKHLSKAGLAELADFISESGNALLEAEAIKNHLLIESGSSPEQTESENQGENPA